MPRYFDQNLFYAIYFPIFASFVSGLGMPHFRAAAYPGHQSSSRRIVSAVLCINLWHRGVVGLWGDDYDDDYDDDDDDDDDEMIVMLVLILTMIIMMTYLCVVSK